MNMQGIDRFINTFRIMPLMGKLCVLTLAAISSGLLVLVGIYIGSHWLR